ncbi:MAG: DoxX family protein [Bacteroidota bacterium]
MSDSTIRIIYYVSTGLLTLLMLFSAGMYLFNTEMIKEAFTALGYPTYIIYPLAIAKLLGLVAIWTRLSPTLFEWAYAGFFFDTLLAAAAHLMVQDGGQGAAFVGVVLVLVSYWASKRV